MSREEQISSQKSSNASEVIKVSCRYCKSTNLLKRGFRKTQNRGLIQRYYCRNCKKRFVIDDGFFRMRNDPQKITLCLDLFFRGVSLRKVQEHLQAFMPHNSSHMSVLRWVNKYPKMISKYTDRLPLKTGYELQVDEMEYKTKGRQSWFVDVLDTETRYMVYSAYVRNRSIGDLKTALLKSKKRTGDQIKVVTTDGLTAYEKIVKHSFGYNNHTRNWNVTHKRVTASKGQGFNHKIERLHNSIRERTKVFRGFKSIESANNIMKGYEIFYNFIRKHQAIEKCPYELAIPTLKLETNNKWKELIQLSK